MPEATQNPTAPAAPIAPAVTTVTPAPAVAAPAAPVAAKPTDSPAPILAPAKVEETTVTTTAAVEPVKYEFKAPEGKTLDATQIAAYTPLFQKHGIKQEVAQELIDESFKLADAQMKTWDETIEKQLVQANNDRIKATKEHPEYGGAKFEANAKAANAALAQFDPKGALHKVLLENGLASDPEVFGLFVRVAQKLGESSPPQANQSNGGKQTDTAILYPSMQKPN